MTDHDREPVIEEELGEDPGTVEESAPAASAAAGPDSARDAAEPGSGQSGPAESEDRVSVLTRERDEYLDMVRRVQAEFENYKKRILRQQTEHLERAAETLVVKLLPALDTLDLALSHHDPESEVGTALAQVATAWRDALAKEGLEKIDPLGQPFDPNEADAVMHEPADEEGTAHEVVEVLRPGYRWRGRVVRPAMVKVKG